MCPTRNKNIPTTNKQFSFIVMTGIKSELRTFCSEFCVLHAFVMTSSSLEPKKKSEEIRNVTNDRDRI